MPLERWQASLAIFLLLSSAFRDIPGGGWLDYDVSFRKHVAENPSTKWGEIMPTLWMTTMMAKASAKPKPSISARFSFPCFRWNSGSCELENCKFQHHCKSCQGPHPEIRCPNKSSSESRKQPADSSPPVPRKKHSK